MAITENIDRSNGRIMKNEISGTVGVGVVIGDIVVGLGVAVDPMEIGVGLDNEIMLFIKTVSLANLFIVIFLSKILFDIRLSVP